MYIFFYCINKFQYPHCPSKIFSSYTFLHIDQILNSPNLLTTVNYNVYLTLCRFISLHSIINRITVKNIQTFIIQLSQTTYKQINMYTSPNTYNSSSYKKQVFTKKTGQQVVAPSTTGASLISGNPLALNTAVTNTNLPIGIAPVANRVFLPIVDPVTKKPLNTSSNTPVISPSTALYPSSGTQLATTYVQPRQPILTSSQTKHTNFNNDGTSNTTYTNYQPYNKNYNTTYTTDTYNKNYDTGYSSNTNYSTYTNPGYSTNTDKYKTSTTNTNTYNTPGMGLATGISTYGTGNYGTTGKYTTGNTYGTSSYNNTPYQTTTKVTTGNYRITPAYTRGQHLGWTNHYGLSVPVIAYQPGCKKCHGTGATRSKLFSSTVYPCSRCYTRAGYCKKCFGTGISYRKNKPCHRCNAGKRITSNRSRSSSSSDSDRQNRHQHKQHGQFMYPLR